MPLSKRGVDVMKWAKDALDNPVTQARIDELLETSVPRDFSTSTHVALSMPMNTNAEAIAARGSAFAIEPAAYAARFVTAIRAGGKKVLWRLHDCRMEGTYNFPRWVGANRYPAGTANMVLAPTITDDFERASLGSAYQTAHQAGNDWSIVNGVAKGPAANGWKRTLLRTQASTKNVVAVAKVRKIGNQQLVIRATTDANFPGYGFQLRSGEFRLERPGLANLASVAKTFTENSWYWIKAEANGSTIRGKVWLDGTSEPGAWDISITNTDLPNAGYVGFSGESNGGEYDSLTVTQTADRANWLGRNYNYIVNNPTLFEDGDLWGPYPERTETEAKGTDATHFLPGEDPPVHPQQITANYANFFVDLKTVSDAAFATIGKPGVITGMTAQNWSEVNSGWLDNKIFTQVGMLIVDHYSDGQRTPTQMKTELRTIKNQRGLPVFLQEWGDYWSTNPDPVYGFNRNQAQHEAYLDSMYAAFQELVDEGTLVGFNYWQITDGHEGLYQDDDPGAGYDYQLNYKGLKLQDFFDANAGVTPTAPSNLTATTASTTAINLAWDDNSSDETGFRIERKTGAGSFAEIALVAAGIESYSDTGLTPNTLYTYRVRAYNANGNSAYSNEDSDSTDPLTPPITPPAAPSGLSATPVSASQINLSWADNSSVEDGFKIERKTGVSGTYAQIATVGPDVTIYHDTTGLPLTTYFYRVRAYNAGGNSSYATETSAATLANVWHRKYNRRTSLWRRKYRPVETEPEFPPNTLSGPLGGNLSGMEFPGAIPGSAGSNWFPHTAQNYQDFKDKGLQAVRLAVSWERLQNTLNSAFNTTYKAAIDEQIGFAKAAGLPVVIDVHSFGRYNKHIDGGITEDFTANPLMNFQYEWADYNADGSIVLRNYAHATIGSLTNGNKQTLTFKMKFNTKDDSFGGEGLYVQVLRTNDNNYYEFGANLDDSQWYLKKKVAGSLSTLASGSKTWGTSATYTIEIDVSRATNGKINIKVDGTNLYTADSVNTDAGLTAGQAQFYAPGVHVKIGASGSPLILNVNGDTTSGGYHTFAIGSAEVPISAYVDLVNRMSVAWKNEVGVFGYDPCNEPHDMPVPLTPSTVATATTTLMNQAAIDVLVANGDNKYYFWEYDSFSNMHRMVELYGNLSTAPWNDPRGRTAFSPHHYPDTDHSGTFVTSFTQADLDRVVPEVTPALELCKTLNVPIFIGESGVEPPEWLPCLERFLETLSNYHTIPVAFFQWAEGNQYSSATKLDINNPSGQMSVISQFTGTPLA